MKNLLSIPIQSLSNHVWYGPGTYNSPTSLVGLGVGGGTENQDSPAGWGWPERCTEAAPYDCKKTGSCSYGGMVIGQQYPTTDPSPDRRVTVTSALGVDKTDDIAALGDYAINWFTGPQYGTGGVSGEVTGFFTDTSGSCGPYNKWTNGITIFEPGDVIRIPGGTVPGDSWNPQNDSTGHPAASLEINITVQAYWLTPLYDTSPLEINIDQIICAYPISTTQVALLTNLPTSLQGPTGHSVAYILDMAEAAPTAMSLVTCINSFLKKSYNSPGTDATVDWSLTGSVTQHVNQYEMNSQFLS